MVLEADFLVPPPGLLGNTTLNPPEGFAVVVVGGLSVAPSLKPGGSKLAGVSLAFILGSVSFLDSGFSLYPDGNRAVISTGWGLRPVN